MGLLSSDSREIFDEIALIGSKKISEGNIFKTGSKRFREKILESERDKPIIQVNKGLLLKRSSINSPVYNLLVKSKNLEQPLVNAHLLYIQMATAVAWEVEWLIETMTFGS
jgi:hypothetical protein